MVYRWRISMVFIFYFKPVGYFPDEVASIIISVLHWRSQYWLDLKSVSMAVIAVKIAVRIRIKVMNVVGGGDSWGESVFPGCWGCVSQPGSGSDYSGPSSSEAPGQDRLGRTPGRQRLRLRKKKKNYLIFFYFPQIFLLSDRQPPTLIPWPPDLSHEPTHVWASNSPGHTELGWAGWSRGSSSSLLQVNWDSEISTLSASLVVLS